VPYFESPSFVRGTTYITCCPTSSGDTGFTESFFDLQVAEKAEYPNKKPDTLTFERAIAWFYPGRNLQQEKP